MKTKIITVLTMFALLFGCTNPDVQENKIVQKQNEAVPESSSQWIVEPGGPIMGTGELKYGIGFMPEQQSISQTQVVDELSHEAIVLYSFMPSDVEIVSTDHVWTYRVYRITDGHEEVVYSQEVYNEDNPFYSGDLPSRNFAYNSFEIAYWNEENTKAGEYKIVLEHPEMLLYRDEKGELQRVLFAEGTGGDLFFTCKLTIE